MILRWTGRNIAKVCSWCDQPMSEQDAEAIRENPAITRSHGICQPCRALHFAGLDEASKEPISAA